MELKVKETRVEKLTIFDWGDSRVSMASQQSGNVELRRRREQRLERIRRARIICFFACTWRRAHVFLVSVKISKNDLCWVTQDCKIDA